MSRIGKALTTVFAHPVQGLAARVFVRMKADWAEEATPANRLLGIGP